MKIGSKGVSQIKKDNKITQFLAETWFLFSKPKVCLRNLEKGEATLY